MSKTLLDLFNEQINEPKKEDVIKKEVEKDGITITIDENLDTAIYKPKKLTNKIGFGKYKGQTLKEVIDEAPSYITFLLNSKTFDFRIDNEAMRYYQKIMRG